MFVRKYVQISNEPVSGDIIVLCAWLFVIGVIWVWLFLACSWYDEWYWYQCPFRACSLREWYHRQFAHCSFTVYFISCLLQHLASQLIQLSSYIQNYVYSTNFCKFSVLLLNILIVLRNETNFATSSKRK